MLSDLFFRLRALFRRKAVETELDDELRAHFAHEVEKHVALGVPREEATRRASLALGGIEQVKEQCREARGTHLLESVWQDLRYALRMLRKTPGFTLAALIILALGIGSNTAVFSLIDSLLLRSLAVPKPRELVHISFGTAKDHGPLSGPMFDRLRERQSAFTDVFGWTNSPMILTENGVARPITAAYASGSAFPTLELKPRLGRLLDWQDDEPAGASSGSAAVISESFWIDHFRGTPDVLGQTIIVNGKAATIVGVMPRSFNGITVDYAPQVVLTFAFDVALRGESSGRFRRDSTWLFSMARLKPGVNLARARANLATIADGVLKDSLPPNYQVHEFLRDGRLLLSPGRTGNSPLGQIYGRSLWTLQALVGLLMFICCANLASLQASRTLNRQHELVVRASLGAGRARLVRQLVIESALLAAGGAAAGIVLSQWMSSLLVTYIEQSDFPVFLDLRPNATIFGATIALAALVVILAGALPAFSLARFDAEGVLRSGRQRLVAGQKHRFAASLLPVQVALSLPLASMALLFGASTGKLLRLDPGFRVKGVTFFGVDFQKRPEKGEVRVALYRQMLDSLRHAPGVQAASVLAVRPLGEGGIDQAAAPVEGNGPRDTRLFENFIGTDYFATAGTRVLAGREFSAFDRFGSNPVCILNQAAANLFFPAQNALGKHVRSMEPTAGHPTCEVVGMVVDAKYNSVRQTPPPTIYYFYEQVLPKIDPEFNLGFMTRSQTTAAAVGAYKDALRRFAPDTPLMPPVTMQQQLEDSIGQERLLAALSLFFGGLALFLTAIGIYGLESQRLAQRVPEIGLRMALGAQKRDMLWFILREAALLFVVGLPLGLALTVGASRFVRGLLYEISPLDPRIHVGAVAAMLVAGFLAAYLPARRAMRVDPMVALRHD